MNRPVRNDEEHLSWNQKGLGLDHDPREIKHIGPSDAVPGILLHDLRRCDWLSQCLHESARVYQLQNTFVLSWCSHGIVPFSGLMKMKWGGRLRRSPNSASYMSHRCKMWQNLEESSRGASLRNITACSYQLINFFCQLFDLLNTWHRTDVPESSS